MTSNFEVSVIIPTFRRTEVLHQLLESLKRQVCQCSFEVIVVANLPEPGLKKHVESHGPQFRFLETGRVGANIARNKGLERAKGDVVIFLDDDCYLQDAGFIEKIYRRHEAHPECLGIGGRYLLKKNANSFETAYHLIADHWLTQSKRRRDETTNLVGGNCSFKIAPLGSKLRFDDSIAFGGTETALFDALSKEGFVFLLCDDLLVEHHLKLDLFGLFKKSYLQGFSAGKLSRTSNAARTLHWNATTTLEQSADRLNITFNSSVKRAVSAYEIIFQFGFGLGRSGHLKVAPQFSIARFLKNMIVEFFNEKHFSRIWHQGFLVSDRALAVAAQERTQLHDAAVTSSKN